MINARPKTHTTVKQMTDKWIGFSDKEAFEDLFHSARQLLAYAHRQRGNTTDEDLVEKMIWQLEDIIGYEVENDLK